MAEPDFLLFASDATLFALAGVALFAVAAFAWFAEQRRVRRAAIDAVGWVPWTTVFFLAFFCGAILLVFAVKGWLGG